MSHLDLAAIGIIGAFVLAVIPMLFRGDRRKNGNRVLDNLS